MLLERVVEAWQAVRATRSRLAKVDAVSALLRDATDSDVALIVSYLSGVLPQGRIGIGWAAVSKLDAPAASYPSIELAEIDQALTQVKATSGAGSKKGKADIVEALLARAPADEQEFLKRLLLGDLRQGALEGIMVDAVAAAAEIDAALVRRAAMVTGDLPLVATEALPGGPDALDRFGLEIFTALQPMLAQSAPDVHAAIEKLDGASASVEWKLDGARVQVHRLGDEVKIYSRNLRDITGQLPEVVRSITALDIESIILDGESVGVRDSGRPMAFQETISQFSSDGEGRLSAIYFDCLHLDGRDLIDLPTTERWDAMASALPEPYLIRRIVTDDADEAQQFFDDAIAAGHEGVMVKGLDAEYAAGRRGASWIKVKPVHTLDLIVLAVEWGSGRRSGWLSNIHLGARDPDTGEFVMLGKTFKGMTDEMLAWQTERFLELEVERKGHVVHVRPEQVVEIAVDGVQRSTRYPGKVALRFARVKQYRDDKRPDQVDTLATVHALF